MAIEANLGSVNLSTNVYCDELEDISDLEIFLNPSAATVNAVAGYMWPAGLYLPKPDLVHFFKNVV